jgi:hypothetical protein
LLPVYIRGVDLKGHGFAAIPFMEGVLRFLLGRCAWFWKEFRSTFAREEMVRGR